MKASIDLDFTEACLRCGGDGRETAPRRDADGTTSDVWVGRCPGCVAGQVPTQLGYNVLNLMRAFGGHPDFDVFPLIGGPPDGQQA